MSPEERKQSGADLFAEYHERRQCLAILDQQLRDLGKKILDSGKAIQLGSSPVDSEHLESMVAQASTKLDDYHATYERCSGLLQALGRSGYGDTLKGLEDYPER